MLVNGKHYKTIWMGNNLSEQRSCEAIGTTALKSKSASVYMIEQNKLPFSFEIHECKTHKDTAHAIKTMIIRGAPAIGAAGAFGMAQAFVEADKMTELHQKENKDNSAIDAKKQYIENARKLLENTRPTAQNLFYAINRVYNIGMNKISESLERKSKNDSAIGPAATALKEAQMIADESIAECEAIGKFGELLIKDGMNLAIHCNPGWIACVDWGTATAPMYMAHKNGKKIHVYVDETGPRGQGGRLTAWEFYHNNIPHTIIPDNATAHYMSHGKIDLMIVGADRIAANGDTANKIGTMEKAIAAKEFGIPFYIAAPLSTFDIKCPDGKAIPIEERSEQEVLCKSGIDNQGKEHTIQIYNPCSNAKNPAFDVTPARFITGIITEKGIVRPDKEEIMKLFR